MPWIKFWLILILRTGRLPKSSNWVKEKRFSFGRKHLKSNPQIESDLMVWRVLRL
jgi:hypothetical protein